MDIQASKIELAKLILDLDNPDLIERIRKLVFNENEDFWTTLSDDEKSELELGIKQLNEGKRVSLDDFLKKAR